MVFYLVNIIIFLIYSFSICLVGKNKKGIGKTIIILSCIQFGGIMALRSSNIGTDTKMYTDLFTRISYSSTGDV